MSTTIEKNADDYCQKIRQQSKNEHDCCLKVKEYHDIDIDCLKMKITVVRK